jgi:mannose-6-phosphate isomerase-like protein (cupin superfamily)
MQKIALNDALAGIREYWRPKVIGSLNGQDVKLARMHGEFIWHHHIHADELFLGVRGTFRIEFHDGAVTIGPGEMCIVPRGVEHRTVADEEAAVLIFEPEGTRNTGNVEHPTLTAWGGDG